MTLHPKSSIKRGKIALLPSVTLSGTTVPRGAQRRRKGVNFHGKGERACAQLAVEKGENSSGACRVFPSDVTAKPSGKASENIEVIVREIFIRRLSSMAGLSLKKRKIDRRKKLKAFSSLSSRFFAYIFPPPKIALFSERTLKKTTASSAGEGEFSRQSLARLICGAKRGRTQAQANFLRMLGFSLKRRRKVLRADVFAI